MLHPDRYFDPEPAVRDIARVLYERVATCHWCAARARRPAPACRERPFPDRHADRGSGSLHLPHALLQGIRWSIWACHALMARLWKPIRGASGNCSPRTSICSVALHWLLAETRTRRCFGVTSVGWRERHEIYDQIAERLARPSIFPGLCSSDFASRYFALRMPPRTHWLGTSRYAIRVVRRVLPTFRPDAVIDILRPSWNRRLRNSAR